VRVLWAGAVRWEQATGTSLNLTIFSSGDYSPMHFTGKQRDYETSLDYFGARYFGGGNNLGNLGNPETRKPGNRGQMHRYTSFLGSLATGGT
jgi:hypothetical protein